MNKRLVLLNKSELNYILENKKFSKPFEYKIKSQLKKKILLFLENEFPLLLQSGLININDLQDYLNDNMLPILGKEKVAGPKVWKHAGIPAQGFSFEHYFHCLMRKNEFLCYCI
jgi:hypothetical protein